MKVKFKIEVDGKKFGKVIDLTELKTEKEAVLFIDDVDALIRYVTLCITHTLYEHYNLYKIPKFPKE
jgi:hypothetical protein